MMNRSDDYTPFLALFEFGVKMCSKSFVGMELLRTIVPSQFPRQSNMVIVEQVKMVYHF